METDKFVVVAPRRTKAPPKQRKREWGTDGISMCRTENPHAATDDRRARGGRSGSATFRRARHGHSRHYRHRGLRHSSNDSSYACDVSPHSVVLQVSNANKFI